MPDTAFVSGRGLCSVCGQQVLQGVRCQWGMVPGVEYVLGDSVVWLRDAAGAVVEPFTLTKVGAAEFRWNCGDPRFRNVVLLDTDIYRGGYDAKCARCHTRIAAGAAVIRDGVFDEVKALTDEQVDLLVGPMRATKTDIVVVRDDETLWPRDDWNGKTVLYVPDP